MPMNLGSLLYERLSDSRTVPRQVLPQIVRWSSGHHAQRDTVKVNSHLAAGDATHVDDASALEIHRGSLQSLYHIGNFCLFKYQFLITVLIF